MTLLVLVSSLVVLLSKISITAAVAVALVALLLTLGHWLQSLRGRP